MISQHTFVAAPSRMLGTWRLSPLTAGSGRSPAGCLHRARCSVPRLCSTGSLRVPISAAPSLARALFAACHVPSSRQDPCRQRSQPMLGLIDAACSVPSWAPCRQRAQPWDVPGAPPNSCTPPRRPCPATSRCCGDVQPYSLLTAEDRGAGWQHVAPVLGPCHGGDRGTGRGPCVLRALLPQALLWVRRDKSTLLPATLPSSPEGRRGAHAVGGDVA